MSDCIFCKIAAGQIPSDKILETDDLLAFRDINPQAPVHVLIIPKKHIASAMDLAASDAGLLAKLLEGAQQIARQHRLDATGFRLVTNHGAQAGQSVFHLHFHLLGGRSMRWPPG
ncbi:MAG: histidine triad nucleotide-binding protein [Candidatus Wallbacteria bacterium]|nr:histidine triad nucleotide-binding protein [Candidatus Wallbacteria bacterium]